MFVERSRNIRVDTLRGVACVLLVVYHVVGNTPFSGLRLSEGFLREFNDLLIYIRMPLFTVLSGFVYAYRPFKGQAGKFVQGKLRRLILPMLTVGTAFALLQSVTPGANGGVENWSLLHIDPYAHYWFVEALFIIFICVLLLELTGAFRSPFSAVIVLGIAVAIFLSPLRFHWFGVSGAMYLFPYFLLGMYLNRFDLIQRFNSRYAVAVIVLICLIVFFLQDQISGDKRGWQSLIIGTLFCSCLLASNFKLGLLARIGVYSYSIYLFHVFFTAASRILWGRVGIDHIAALLLLGTFAGLVGPIIVEIILTRNRYTRLLFLGQSFKKK